MKNKTKNAIKTRMTGNRVQVWLGTPDDPESDFIFEIDLFWVPSLIAALTPFKTRDKN
jgi:hypothetical protein